MECIPFVRGSLLGGGKKQAPLSSFFKKKDNEEETAPTVEPQAAAAKARILERSRAAQALELSSPQPELETGAEQGSPEAETGAEWADVILEGSPVVDSQDADWSPAHLPADNSQDADWSQAHVDSLFLEAESVVLAAPKPEKRDCSSQSGACRSGAGEPCRFANMRWDLAATLLATATLS